jgi:hypothetical protein
MFELEGVTRELAAAGPRPAALARRRANRTAVAAKPAATAAKRAASRTGSR